MLSRVWDWLVAAPLLARRIKSLSFSQYGEDLALAAALLPRRKGFYVDVGAFAPAHLSNTYRLYLRGWRGVTIEPNPDLARRFRRMRPRDTHLVMGVAERDGDLLYRRFDNPTLNTFDSAQAETWTRLGHRFVAAEPVACRPLGAILADAADGHDIDLLCVDCEGFDLAVLRSHDWRRFRPAAVLVEDHPRFQALTESSGESAIADLLRGLGYAPITQTMFSFLWVDRAALTGQRSCAGFDLAACQARPATGPERT